MHAVDYSIFMDLTPSAIPEHQVSSGLDRETAYFAMEEFRRLVALYGAMQGKFEIWSFGHRRSLSTMHVIEWPETSQQ